MNRNLFKVMTNSGLVVYERDTPLTVRFDRKETDKLVKKKIDYDKFDDHCEVAHLEISNVCNMDCKYCYVQSKNRFKDFSFPENSGALTDEHWKIIIKKLKDYGIFQITFGGGEPLLRTSFPDLAYHAKELGLNVGMTSNGVYIPKVLPAILENFRQINISWHQNLDVVEKALQHLWMNKIPRGINYCFSKKMAEDNETVKLLAREYEAELLYLAYKPVVGDYDNLILPADVYKVAKEAHNEGLKVAVDGPCVGKCMMKKRFVDIAHNGDVYPCSFIRTSIGNILKDDFKNIWKNRGRQEPCPYLEMAESEV